LCCSALTSQNNNDEKDGEEFAGSEAEDTVGDLPSLMEQAPLDSNHGSIPANISLTSSSPSADSLLSNNNRKCDINTQDVNLPTPHETKSASRDDHVFLKPRDPIPKTKPTSKDDHGFLRPRDATSNGKN